jgi:PadR family transcriptional regulator, regulatory protein AphA
MNTPNESESQDRAVAAQSATRDLTTTSFAVLSILALRDHSTYELARQMRLSLHYLWPRAESNVYAEPRRLVEAGLVQPREEWSGRRRRVVYRITDAGRSALGQWLAAPSARQRYESEALLKVLFAENGTKAELIAAVRAIATDATAIIGHFLDIADQYAAGDGQYPGRFALTGLAARLLLEQQAATLRWAAWAEESVGHWGSPLAETAEWGVQTLRGIGQSFPLREDPLIRARRGRADR